MAADKTLGQYFIALIPPSPIYEEGTALKQYLKEKYNTKAALNSPPHLTLHMPFKWKEENEQSLLIKLQSFRSGVKPFTLQLLNFNAFPPRVIFIDVVHNEQLIIFQNELVKHCKRELNFFNADYKNRPYHPHLTLAFRDLKKQNFKEAWSEFSTRTFSKEFIIEKFYLLKHNGCIWQPYKDYNI